MIHGLYAYELQQKGLPVEGLSQNSHVLSNNWDLVNYLDGLVAEQKVSFLELLTENAYNVGLNAQFQENDE